MSNVIKMPRIIHPDSNEEAWVIVFTPEEGKE
jgi:hypothetical protein